MSAVERVTTYITAQPYPVDLAKLVMNVAAILEEYAHCDVPLSTSTVKQLVTDSLDILESEGYDLEEEFEGKNYEER